jgi:type VI secretion system secreted protein Hcp
MLKSKKMSIYKSLVCCFIIVYLVFPGDTEAKIDTGESILYGADHSSFMISIEGENQGLITKKNGTQISMGNLWFEAFQDFIYGLGLSHGVEVPTDQTTGIPIGPPIHHELRLSKYFDKCTPLLYQALISGEKLKVIIKFYRVTPTGSTEHYFTIELIDAYIVDIESGADVRSESGFSQYQHTEGVSFVYKTATWTHELVGTSTTDDWDSAP